MEPLSSSAKSPVPMFRWKQPAGPWGLRLFLGLPLHPCLSLLPEHPPASPAHPVGLGTEQQQAAKVLQKTPFDSQEMPVVPPFSGSCGSPAVGCSAPTTLCIPGSRQQRNPSFCHARKPCFPFIFTLNCVITRGPSRLFFWHDKKLNAALCQKCSSTGLALLSLNPRVLWALLFDHQHPTSHTRENIKPGQLPRPHFT